MPHEPIEKGLAEAFGAEPAARPGRSVLRALQARTGSRLGVHLDSPLSDDAPVRVTPEAKELRDPSGRYQVLGEVGRGGVGVVYKGRDTDLGRDVAMKVLKDEYASHPEVLARFVEEAQIGGQLQHPGIVPVYELGLQAGERPYFAMKLVKGETLAAQLARRDEPSEDRRRLLGVFEQVCQTIAYAHARHVVHRDLKPSNVMIGAFGEVQVVDWGFAKVLARGGVVDETRASARSVIETVRSRPGSGSHSLPGSMLGTPAYMPPEQAQGDIARVDRRSDVFALGAILCEILTGQPPYREQDGDLVRQAAAAELDGAYARLKDCGADESLVKLCLECLARTQRARPESAAEVAERVSAYLTSVEERARRAELDAAEARYRNRMTVVAAASGLVVVLLGAGTWIWIQGEAQERRTEARQRVASSMSSASAARGRAQAAGLDAASWSAAVSSAEQLAALARSRDVKATTRAEAEAFLARVREEAAVAYAERQRRERDAVMLARLEEVRIPTDDDVREHGWQVRESRRLDAEYAGAFAEYLGEVSLVDDGIDDVLTSMRRGDIEVTLAAALDHWSLVRDRFGAGQAPEDRVTARLREIAARLDGDDPWRSKLRGLLPKAAREGERLRALAEEGESTADACRVLGEALCRAGEKEAVVAVLGRGQELRPDDFGLCVDLALHLELLDEPAWEQALAMYRVAHALRPRRTGVLHRQGVALDALGRHEDAERVFRRVSEQEPENAHVLCHLGRALADQDKLDEALATFERALAVDPNFDDAHMMIGIVRSRRGSAEDGLESYRRAVRAAPGKAVHHYNLGTALMEAGRFDEAIVSLRRATELVPGYTSAYVNLGNALSDMGELDEAVAAYLRALDLDSERVHVHYNLGNAYRRLGRPTDAAASFERALALDPENAAALQNLGNVLSDLGELERAIECYDRALELEPTSAEIHHNLGIALERAGRFDEARRSFERALELQPGLSPSRNKLARLERIDSLVEVLEGREEAASPTEWAEVVLLGYEQRRFGEVVALTETTLHGSRGLAKGGLYNSACTATLLAATSEDDASEKSRVRELARAWLATDFESWKTWLTEGGGRAAEAREMLDLALHDPDLASVRGDALEELPDDERAAWRELWDAIGRAAQ